MLKALMVATTLCFATQVSSALSEPSTRRAMSCDRLEPAVKSTTKRIAIVIGNSAYKEAIGSLLNPINDAKNFSTALSKLGFEVFLSTDASDEGLQACFANTVRALEKVDVAVLYYSGHGIQIQDENYLVGVNVDAINPALKGFVPV